jgi:hypothetical protein
MRSAFCGFVLRRIIREHELALTNVKETLES